MTSQELEARVTRLEDIHEIENLQNRYTHHLMMKEAKHEGYSYEDYLAYNVFAQKSAIRTEASDSGWREASAEQFKAHLEDQNIQSINQQRGIMGGMKVMVPVIEVSKDGKTARGLFREFASVTLPGTLYPGDPPHNKPLACWQDGKYDNEFVKEDGKWRIRSRRFVLNIRTPYDQGWIKQPIAHSSTFSGPRNPPTYFAPYHIDKYNEFLPGPPEPEE